MKIEFGYRGGGGGGGGSSSSSSMGISMRIEQHGVKLLQSSKKLLVGTSRPSSTGVHDIKWCLSCSILVKILLLIKFIYSFPLSVLS